MGLLDMFKDKAAELIQTAKDQVSDRTGVDLQAGDSAGEQVQQATEQVSDSAAEQVQQVSDSAGIDTPIDAAGSVTDAGQNAADTAHDAVDNATDKLPGQ